MAPKNRQFQNAKNNKKDEFYTQLSDIESEMKHYVPHFKGKTVFCNCDDPRQSNFWRFFHAKFNSLGLKKLISTHYEPTTLFFNEKSFKMEYEGKGEPVKTYLEEDGDFRSEECVDLLKLSDIVITNPPFSLFRQYISQLVEFNKKFIIMGNMGAVTYKEFRPHFVNNKIWCGCSIKSGDREFRVPDYYPITAANSRSDNEGNNYIRVKGVRWFTNLPHKHRLEPMTLHRKYNPKSYPKYENYNAIEVSKIGDIPVDYDGEMGVPISLFDKYNPDQFEIISFDEDLPKTSNIKPKDRFVLNGRRLYVRIVIKHKGRKRL